MDAYAQMLARLRGASAAERMFRLYGHREGEQARQLARYTRLLKAHEDHFHANDKPLYFISAPGRTEIAGNHTDHNNGRVLAAAVNVDTVACVSPRSDDVACIHSEGFPGIEADLSVLSVHPEEAGTSAALVRGVAAGMKAAGYELGGFDAVMTSDVRSGSGLSSSAAYEVLICAVLDALYNGFTVDAVKRAQIGQYAENVYFGKPSGLMDQTASSVGGLVTIDFENEPVVQPLSFSFADAGYTLVVVNVGSSHDNLTDEYAAIRGEMQAVAEYFGEKVLRQVRPEQVTRHLSGLREQAGERAILRAFHFFEENERVCRMVQAVRAGDMQTVLRGINASGDSSWRLLQNLYPAGSTRQPMALALALAAGMLREDGAWRVHGGGFAGTTLNVVPNDRVPCFVEKMENVFGLGSCTLLDIRPEGAAVVLTSGQAE